MSLIGTFGASQLSIDNQDNLNTVDKKESVELFDTVKEMTSDKADDRDETQEVTIESVENTTQQETIEKKIEVSKEVVSNKTTTENKTVTKATPAKETVTVTTPAPVKEKVAVATPVPAKENVTVTTPAPVKETVAVATKSPARETVVAASPTPVKEANVTNTPVQNNVQVNGVNKIDFSQCNSVEDIIAVLKKNGYSNVNSGNVQNVLSMDQISNLIQQNNASYNNTTVNKPNQQTTNTIINKTVNNNTTNNTTVNKPATNNTTTNTTNNTTVNKPVNNNTTTNNTVSKPVTNNTTTNTTTNSGISSYANQVLQLVNQERAKAGLSALTSTPELQAAATKRAQETVQNFSHTRPNGTQWSTVLKEYNVPNMRSGENIAMGQRTPQEVVTAWMNSPGHRANIMNGSFGRLGVGVYESNGRLYWAQLFTN